jgi:hypothetical protein
MLAPSTTTPTTNPSGLPDYDIPVISSHRILIPNPNQALYLGLAFIPLPPSFKMATNNIIVMHGPAFPLPPEDAMSYLNLWALFANGHLLPDPFCCLFQALGIMFHPTEAHNAMLRYGIVHQIAITHLHTLDWHAINMFLVTLPAFEHNAAFGRAQQPLGPSAQP